MMKNYLKIAWRNIVRDKAYSGINILGLAIGVATCLLILQYVTFELSYENFHVNRDRIYRVQQDRYDKGKLSTQWAAGAFAAGNQFKDAIPEIEDYVKLKDRGEVVIEQNNQPVKINKVFFASSSFFNIFTYPLVEGNKATALTELNTVALSQTTARTLFGNTSAVGKSIKLNGKTSYTVSAVFKDAPVNTQLKPNILISYATFIKSQRNGNPETEWLADGMLAYVLLRKDVDPAVVEAKFLPIVEKQVGEDMKKYNSSVTYLLQPLKDIHLHSH